MWTWCAIVGQKSGRWVTPVLSFCQNMLVVVSVISVGDWEHVVWSAPPGAGLRVESQDVESRKTLKMRSARS